MTISKFKISNKVLSMLLCAALLLSFVPLSSLKAFALEIPIEKNITLGSSALKGAQVSKVYFGNYQQSSNGKGGYNVDPIKWSVLSNAGGKLFLLSEQNLDVVQYHTTYRKLVAWETSTIRSWLNGYGSTYNNQNVDYTGDNFIGTAFSAAEQTAIAGTTDKVLLLSSEEAKNAGYGFAQSSKRTAINTAYVAGGGKIGGSMWGVGEADSWWLRSPVSKVGSSYNATYVGEHGSILENGINVDSNMVAVRPAFNIDLSHVLFTSAAKDGKADGFNATTAYSGKEYKLTLSDSGRSTFKATLNSISNNTVNVSYSGATTGTNEYISAIIKDASGSVTYYGRLKNVADTSDADGTVTLDLPNRMNRRTDTLYIFNEQYNGDYKTDYASELIEISYTITFDAGDGTVSPTTAVTGMNGKLTSLPTPTRDNYNFIGWYTAATDGEKVDLDKVYTGNTTLYAVWEKAIVKATAITLDKASITLDVGDTEKLFATVAPENATNKSLIWNSFKPTVATVDQNGNVTAVAPGTAIITVAHAVDTGCQNTFCVVTVNKIAITGTVSISGETVYGKTLTANYSGNETVTYQWYRGDDAISGATSSTYTLTADDMGKVIKVKASGTGNYSGSTTAQTATAVDKATATLTAPTAQNEITYGAKLSTVGLNDGWVWANGDTVPTVKNNGYVAYYTPADTDNYDWTMIDGWNETEKRVERTVPVTVNKAPLTVKAKNKTITYGDAPANDGVTYEGFVNGESETVLDGTLAYDYGYAQYGNVGEFDIIPKGLSSDNYAITFENGTLTVKKADQKAPAVQSSDETISGKKDGVITAVNSTMEYRKDGESTYTAISGETVTDLAAGKYYVRVKGDSNHNPSPDTEVTIAAGRKLNESSPKTGYSVLWLCLLLAASSILTAVFLKKFRKVS